MEPSQINHLREAAADIRINLEKLRTLLYVASVRDVGGVEELGLERIGSNIERALTRIEMCLKEIK